MKLPLLLCVLAAPATANPMVPATDHTVVFVHDAWGGAYAWKEVDSLLAPEGRG